jgi:hypothetical protein
MRPKRWNDFTAHFYHGTHCAVSVPDPNDHRRFVVSHRRGGHESHDAGKCDRYSGRAVEAAGDVDILLLDKTGTITLGNRQASEFFLRPA